MTGEIKSSSAFDEDLLRRILGEPPLVEAKPTTPQSMRLLPEVLRVVEVPKTTVGRPGYISAEPHNYDEDGYQR